MAGNRRGKIKEHLAGCHSNLDWCNHHLETTLVLIKEHNPNLTEGIEAFQKAVSVLDDQLMSVYAMI